MGERRAKPPRVFKVSVRGAEPIVISGETFFYARAAYCARNASLKIEPHEVRLSPEGKHGETSSR